MAVEDLKLLVSVAMFWIAFVTYSKTQRWKRKEFVSSQMEKFIKDPAVILSMHMLDWLERPLQLKNGKIYEFKKKDLNKILGSDEKTDKLDFSAEEAELRDSFSTFFDYLQQFENDIESGLIKEKDLEIYLIYGLKKISAGSTSKNLQTVEKLSTFVKDYDYNGITKLVGRYLGTESDTLFLKSK